MIYIKNKLKNTNIKNLSKALNTYNNPSKNNSQFDIKNNLNQNSNEKKKIIFSTYKNKSKFPTN